MTHCLWTNILGCRVGNDDCEIVVMSFGVCSFHTSIFLSKPYLICLSNIINTHFIHTLLRLKLQCTLCSEKCNKFGGTDYKEMTECLCQKISPS